MTLAATGLAVPRMAEKDKIADPVHAHRRELPDVVPRVTGQALGRVRQPGALRGPRLGMTVRAGQFQRRVLLVAERRLLAAGRPR